MIFTLTDRKYNVLDAYETDDYLIGIYTGYIIKSLDLNVFVNSSRAEHWVEGNYVFCKDVKGRTYWFTIRDVEDGAKDDEKSLTCYSGTLDILNEDANPIVKPATAQPFSYYFNKVFFDTGIVLGRNEISGLTRRLEFTSESASNVEMLQYVLNGFDGAEADVAVEMNGSVPSKVVLDVYKRIGKEEPQTILTDEDNSLLELDRIGSVTDLATCVYPVGMSDDGGAEITLVGKYYEEKDNNGDILYYSPVDSPRIFSVEARKKYYVEIPGKANGEFDGYINRKYSSEASTRDALWTSGLSQLKKIDHAIVTYDAFGYINCQPGDNIQIVSNRMQPPVTISARVMEYKYNDDDPSRNEYKFGNYKNIESNMDSLSKLIEKIKKTVVTIVSQEVSYKIDAQGEEPPASGWSPSYVSPDAGQWLWTRTVTYLSNGSNSVAYSVSRVGEDGYTPIRGIDYFDGEPGLEGTSSYLWIMYSQNANGDPMTNNPDGAKYIGIVTTITNERPTNVSSYSWSLIKGTDGATGPPTGITESTTIPSSPYTGMLWRHTGTISGYITGATYRYNGSAWSLYLFHSENISATNLAAISANLGAVNAGIINAQTGDMVINLNNGSLTTGGDAIKSKVDISRGVLEQRGENIGNMAGFRADKYGVKISHFNGTIGQAPATTETWAGTRMYQQNADFTISSPASGDINIVGGALKVHGAGTSDVYNSLLYAHKGLAVDGDTVVTGDIVMSGSNSGDKSLKIAPDSGNAGLELGSTKAVSTPFIDFHSTGWTHDYDARIIAEGGVGGGANGTAGLNFIVSDLKINNNVIVSYGSNTNGHWIRFYDGTLICWGRERRNVPVNLTNGQIFRSNQLNYTYPMAFTGPFPHVTISAFDCLTALMVIESRTNFSVMLFKGTSNDNLGTQISWQAIGRWY